MTNTPDLGFGLGLRKPHYQDILQGQAKIDWLEIISENHMVEGGVPRSIVFKARENYPIVMHGTSLSIGGSDPLDKEYLTKLKKLADELQPAWISDHLCWTGVHGIQLHDLMPLPYNEATLRHVVQRVSEVQEFLNRQILLENVSSYVSFKTSDMTEWEFLSEVSKQADCLILLDINNIYVSAFNHGYNPLDFLYSIPKNKVQQFHLAGHENLGAHIIDTHDHPICEHVWDLYEKAIEYFGPISTLIERDDQIPPIDTLIEELQFARKIASSALRRKTLKINNMVAV